MSGKLIIDPELSNLLPPLTKDEYKELEENVLKNGIRDSIVIWDDIIVDGHNRYKIAQKHNLTFNVNPITFEDKNDAKLYILKNQLARRNLTPYTRAEVVSITMKPILKEKAKEKQPKYHGNQYESAPLQNSATDQNDKIDTREEIAKMAGVSHDTVDKVELIMDNAPEEVKEALRKGDTSIHAEYKKVKAQQELEDKKQAYQEKITDKETESSDMKIDILQTDQKFRIIYADPPWSYDDKCKGGGIQSSGGLLGHYDSITIKELCKIPAKDIAEKDAILFLWVTSPLLAECFEVIEAWGFKYKASFIWDKVGHNRGNYNSVRHELLLVCTKGKGTPDNKKLYDSVISIEKTKHSEKPIEFMELIDALYTYGDKIELFCRKPVKDNWHFWGNEV